MVRTIEHYPSETIVVVHAKVRKALQHVKNATIHDYELEVYEVHRVAEPSEHVPFTVYDAENINRNKEDKADYDSGDDTDDDDGSIASASSELRSPTATDTPSGIVSPTTGKSLRSPRPSTDIAGVTADKFTGRRKYSVSLHIHG